MTLLDYLDNIIMYITIYKYNYLDKLNAYFKLAKYMPFLPI